jgi:hypothetical protein
MVVFGCPKDLADISSAWSSGPAQIAQPVNEGTYHVLLRMQ